MSGLEWITWVGWTLAAIGGAMTLVWLVGRSGKHLRRCPKCEYDMRATAGLTCPECGTIAKGERALGRRRRKRTWMRLGVLFVFLGTGTLVFNPNRSDGWASSVPDRVIWRLMPWFDSSSDQWINEFESGRTPSQRFSASRSGQGRWERLLRTRRFVRETAGTAKLASVAPPTWASAGGLGGMLLPVVQRGAPGVDDLGVDPSYVIADLVALTERLDPADRARPIRALGAFAPLKGRAFEVVHAMLGVERSDVWAAAFDVLALTDEQLHALTLGELVGGLGHPRPSVRLDVTLMMYDRVPLPESAVTALRQVQSNDPEQRVRARAGAVLWRNEQGTPGIASPR
jgi:hypothetical protein